MAGRGALLHPLGFRAGNWHQLGFWAADQDQGFFGAGLDTYPAANAAQLVDLDGEIHAECVKLAVLYAVLTGHAQIFVDGVDEGGLGDCVSDAQLADAAQYSTGTGAAVADIGFPALVVADRMNQASFSGDLERAQRLFQVKGADM